MTVRKSKTDLTTESKILESARKVFHKKGFGGARMQEIADGAGINKAMLHYYFRSKDKMFDAVFYEALKKFLPKVKELLNAELPLFEKIEYFAEKYLTILLDNIYLPSFIIYEINQNPKKLTSLLKKRSDLSPDIFLKQINEAIRLKKIKNINPEHLIINMISMCIFPVIWKPVIMKVFGMSEKSFIEFIKERKKEIPEFIVSSIKINKEKPLNSK